MFFIYYFSSSGVLPRTSSSVNYHIAVDTVPMTAYPSVLVFLVFSHIQSVSSYIVLISFLHKSKSHPSSFTAPSKITTGHNYTLVKKQSRPRLDVRKYSFSQRTINVWNKLSTDCVHASSVKKYYVQEQNRQVTLSMGQVTLFVILYYVWDILIISDLVQ